MTASVCSAASQSNELAMHRMATLEEAANVSSFILQADMFGTALTPGEEQVMREHPAQVISRQCDGAYWFVADASERLCAVIGTRMHENQTGIFEITAIAVAPECRHCGIGHRLLERVLKHIRELNGRGLLVDTSSDASYASMRALLADMGFQQVGCFPDFYYPGEDTLWYYRPVSQLDGSV